MLSKIIAVIASMVLMLQPSLSTANIQAPTAPAATLASSAWVTTCIGPMTIQLAPKDRGAVFIAFGVGGCSETSPFGFGIRLGKVHTFASAEPKSTTIRLLQAS
jgi:hypothetical protein